MKPKLLFAIIISSLFGCSTLNTVLKEKENGEGTKIVYDIQFEDAWVLSKSSFRWQVVMQLKNTKLRVIC